MQIYKDEEVVGNTIVEQFEQEGTTPSNLSYCKAAALV